MSENAARSGDARETGCCAELEAVVEVIQQLSMARDLDGVVGIVRREARRLSGADGAAFVLREGDLCYYVDEDAVSPLWKGQRFPMDSCVSGWVMKHGQPVAIEDIDVDPRVHGEAFRATFVKSMLMVPIRPSTPLGAIGNYWAQPHRPTDAEIRLLRALANSTAVALENVLLYSELERRVKERTEALEREVAERRQAEELLRESRQRFAGVVESAMDAIVSIDSDQRIVFFNAAAEVMFRWRAADVLGRTIDCLIPHRFRGAHAERVRGFVAGGVTSRTITELQQLRGLRSDGEEFPIEAAFSKVELAGGVLSTVIVRDISRRLAMEAALRESEARFRNIADTAPAMLWMTEPDGRCSFLSRGWYDYTGQADDAGSGLGWLDAVHPDDREIVASRFLAASGERTPFEHEHRVRRSDGSYGWVLDTGRPRFAADGSFLGFIGSVIDITERKRADEIMRRSALHDPLTNLPNRALVQEFADHLLAASRRAGTQSAVMFIDLDRFKPINDTYGHHIGDAVLKEVASRLQNCVRGEDVVGRLGGDEFVVVLSHIQHVDEAAGAAAHLLMRLSEPYDIRRANAAEPLTLSLSPSIGVSVYPKNGDDLATLIECADVAMYSAKSAGRAAFRIYEAGDEAAFRV